MPGYGGGAASSVLSSVAFVDVYAPLLVHRAMYCVHICFLVRYDHTHNRVTTQIMTARMQRKMMSGTGTAGSDLLKSSSEKRMCNDGIFVSLHL
jgi:hypothetical protein